MDISRSVRRSRLNKSLEDRPPLVDMIHRGLVSTYKQSYLPLDPDISRPLSDRLQKLERHMKEDTVHLSVRCHSQISRSLHNRSNVNDLVRRGIQSLFEGKL